MIYLLIYQYFSSQNNLHYTLPHTKQNTAEENKRTQALEAKRKKDALTQSKVSNWKKKEAEREKEVESDEDEVEEVQPVAQGRKGGFMSRLKAAKGEWGKFFLLQQFICILFFHLLVFILFFFNLF